MPEMTFEVRDEKAEALLKEVGDILRKACPEGYGFSLLLFTFGAGGNMFYASNAKRQDMINAMREFVQKFGAN